MEKYSHKKKYLMPQSEAPIYIVDNEDKILDKISLTKLATESNSTIIVLRANENDGRLIDVSFKTPFRYSILTEDNLIRFLPFQNSPKNIPKKAKCSDSTIDTKHLLKFLKFIDAGFCDGEKIAILLDSNLLSNSDFSDVNIKYKSNILTFTIVREKEAPKTQTRKAEYIGPNASLPSLVNDSMNDYIIKKLALIENGVKTIAKQMPYNPNGFIGNDRKKNENVGIDGSDGEKRIKVKDTEFYYSDKAVYYEEEKLYEANGRKYIILKTLLINYCQGSNPISSAQLAKIVQFENNKLKLSEDTIRNRISEIRKKIRKCSPYDIKYENGYYLVLQCT